MNPSAIQQQNILAALIGAEATKSSVSPFEFPSQIYTHPALTGYGAQYPLAHPSLFEKGLTSQIPFVHPSALTHPALSGLAPSSWNVPTSSIYEPSVLSAPWKSAGSEMLWSKSSEALTEMDQIKSDVDFKRILMALADERGLDYVQSLAFAKQIIEKKDNTLLQKLAAGVPVPKECVVRDLVDDRVRDNIANLILSRLSRAGTDMLVGPQAIQNKAIRDDVFIHRDLARRASAAAAWAPSAQLAATS